MKKCKLAVCQLKPGYNKKKNIEKAMTMIKKASENGAELIMLPEMFYYPYELKHLKKLQITQMKLCIFYKKQQ